MATAPSAQIVISIPEILELILLQLDNQTILTAAQRACRAWRELIHGSSSLQKALFFLPEGHCGREDEKAQNPLLVQRFPYFFFGKEEPVSLLPSLDMIKRPKKLEAYLRPEASWRRMLVQQPPVLVIGLLNTFLGVNSSLEFYEVHVSSLTVRLFYIVSYKYLLYQDW
jgi:hypothetical protein